MTAAQKKHLIDSILQTQAELPGTHHAGPGDLFAQGWRQAIAHLVTKLQPLLDSPHPAEPQLEPPKRTPPHRA